jgi:hypothetical protein
LASVSGESFAAGDRFSSTRTPFSAARATACSTVGSGTSSETTMILTPSKTVSTSPGSRLELAPGETRIEFSPSGVTVM